MLTLNAACSLHFWTSTLGMSFNICSMFTSCSLKSTKKSRNFCHFTSDVYFSLGLTSCDLFLIYKGYNIIVYNIRDKNLNPYFSFWIRYTRTLSPIIWRFTCHYLYNITGFHYVCYRWCFGGQATTTIYFQYPKINHLMQFSSLIIKM